MYQFIYHIIFLLLNPQFFGNIEQENSLKIEFNKVLLKGDFSKAIVFFEQIENVNRLIEPELRLDVAHAYFAVNDTLNARINYEYLQDSPNNLQAAQAKNQLGILALMKGDSTMALNLFKSAIEKNIDNEKARFNFELISRIYHPKSLPPPPQEIRKQSQEIIASEEKEKDLEKYTSNKISKEKALQLLEDLKNSEMKVLISRKNNKKKVEKDW
jgi:tetratricopeptide (TPR) repeat protein